MDYSFDHHVHCGQYESAYFQPAYVIQALHVNGIKRIWLSSSTSNIVWLNKDEKHMLIKHVEDELKEAMAVGRDENVEVLPLYWVVPQRHHEGESIADVMNAFPYCGFKIHPRMKGWEKYEPEIESLLFDICEYAESYRLPVLIHTGVDVIDSPDRFENLFSKYSTVTFTLAHCRKTDTIIRLFSQYSNVNGDCAFCPEESIKEINNAGYSERMHFGTDFPITFWYEKSPENRTVTYKELSEHYRKLLTESTQ